MKSQGKTLLHLEHEIDIIVYKLYEFTYDEVKIVDPDISMSEREYSKFSV